MTLGTTVGICTDCGSEVKVIDEHNARCGCGRTTVYLGHPGYLREAGKLRILPEGDSP